LEWKFLCKLFFLQSIFSKFHCPVKIARHVNISANQTFKFIVILDYKSHTIHHWPSHLSIANYYNLLPKSKKITNKIFSKLLTFAELTLIFILFLKIWKTSLSVIISVTAILNLPYFIEYSAHFFASKRMLKYPLRTIHGR